MCVFAARFRAFELSFKSVSDLFDWWERSIGSLAANFLAEQQVDVHDEKAAKKGKRTAGSSMRTFSRNL